MKYMVIFVLSGIVYKKLQYINSFHYFKLSSLLVHIALTYKCLRLSDRYTAVHAVCLIE